MQTSYLIYYEAFDANGCLVLDGNSYHDVDASTIGSVGQYMLQHVYPVLLNEVQGITPTASRVVLKGVFKL
jgi:hypothetical protein